MSHNTQSGPEGMTFKKGGKASAAANKMSGAESNKPHGNAKQGRRILESVSGKSSKGKRGPTTALARSNISKPRT